MDIREAVKKLFEYEEMGNRRFSRETYAPSFEQFEKIAEDFDKTLSSMYEEMTGGKEEPLEEDKLKEFCEQAAGAFASYVKETEEPGLSRGKREERQGAHNTFMVTYVLPHILEMRNPYYKTLAAEIEKSWSANFKNSKIKAATYETIASGFQRKFFGFSL